MRSFRLAGIIAALLLASCTQGARIDIRIPQAHDSSVAVRLLDVNSYRILDTLRLGADGKASYRVAVRKGEPEFVYIFYKDTKLASLLLMAGDRVSVLADTLGHYEVSGSPESEALAEVESSIGRFASAINAATVPSEMARLYVEHYRESVRYVITHQRSLTVVPVLFEQLDELTPVFSQHTDAILFRQTADTLATVYPESRYVKAIAREATRRENALKVHNLVQSAPQLGFPDIELPDVNGERVSLSSIGSKAVLLHFWDSSDASQKMFNLDVLMPLWDKWHARGLQIYAVDINPDKGTWGSVVKAQNLPWVNVNGARATAQAISLYNVSEVPSSFLIVDGALSTAQLDGSAALSKELARIL
ncbi:MAG: redoxin domain-containing protein [Bacteroidales bacterium]|nr:redoxin domain-containing protein [Bacteroidales bacterium]